MHQNSWPSMKPVKKEPLVVDNQGLLGGSPREDADSH